MFLEHNGAFLVWKMACLRSCIHTCNVEVYSTVNFIHQRNEDKKQKREEEKKPALSDRTHARKLPREPPSPPLLLSSLLRP